MTAPGRLPDWRQRLLLQAAGAGVPVARRAWTEWRGAGELAVADAASVRLLPWLYHRRNELEFSPADMTFLEGVYRFAWMRNQSLLNRCALVVHDLRAAGIEALLLKGVPLLVAAYQDEGGRYLEDFDLLIRVDDADRACQVLERSGWTPRFPGKVTSKGRTLRSSHEFLDAQGFKCDLHWHLFRVPYPMVDETPLWEGRRPILIRDEAAWTLSIEHSLLHLFVHGMAWEEVPPIRWVLDARLLLDGTQPDWDLLLAEAQRKEVRLPVREAMKTYDDLFPGQIPAEMLVKATAFVPTRRERLDYEIVALPYEQTGWQTVLDAYASDWRAALERGEIKAGWSGMRAFLCRRWNVPSGWRLPWEMVRRGVQRIGRRP